MKKPSTHLTLIFKCQHPSEILEGEWGGVFLHAVGAVEHPQGMTTDKGKIAVQHTRIQESGGSEEEETYDASIEIIITRGRQNSHFSNRKNLTKLVASKARAISTAKLTRGASLTSGEYSWTMLRGGGGGGGSEHLSQTISTHTSRHLHHSSGTGCHSNRTLPHLGTQFPTKTSNYNHIRTCQKAVYILQ